MTIQYAAQNTCTHARTQAHRHARARARAHTHTYTHTHTYRHTHTRAKLNLHSIKWAAIVMDEDSCAEQKIWQVYRFGKRNVFRLRLSESREGFCRRGRGRSLHVDGPKTETAKTRMRTGAGLCFTSYLQPHTFLPDCLSSHGCLRTRVRV